MDFLGAIAFKKFRRFKGIRKVDSLVELLSQHCHKYVNEEEVCPVCNGEELEGYKDKELGGYSNVMYFCQRCSSTWNVLSDSEPVLVTNIVVGDVLLKQFLDVLDS